MTQPMQLATSTNATMMKKAPRPEMCAITARSCSFLLFDGEYVAVDCW